MPRYVLAAANETRRYSLATGLRTVDEVVVVRHCWLAWLVRDIRDTWMIAECSDE